MKTLGNGNISGSAVYKKDAYDHSLYNKIEIKTIARYGSFKN